MLLNLLLTLALAESSTRPDFLKNDQAMSCYVTLMAHAGWGRRPDERGAFLVRGPSGIECREWPSRQGHMRATFLGVIPPGTVAIVHTHPIGNPDPSEGDIAEAKRLEIPVILVTPEVLSIVEGGKVHQVARGFGWFERATHEWLASAKGGASENGPMRWFNRSRSAADSPHENARSGLNDRRVSSRR